MGQVGSDLHSSDVWERIVARANLPLERYPLQAASADLEEYRGLAGKRRFEQRCAMSVAGESTASRVCAA